MSFPTAVLGENFFEWRIFGIASQMRSPAFLMGIGMQCELILKPVSKDSTDFYLFLIVTKNVHGLLVCFSCFINDSYHFSFQSEGSYSGEYIASKTISGKSSQDHVCNGISYTYISVKVKWFLLNKWTEMDVLSSSSIRKFASLLESGACSDVVIETEDGSRIPVHRNVLSVNSPVFHAMLKTDMLESESHCIKITDFSSDTVKDMIKYMYTGWLPDVTQESATLLLKAADKYNLKDLKQLCARNILLHLTISNALEILLLADTYREEVLKGRVLQFISENRKEFSEPGTFTCLLETNPSILVDIINILVMACSKECGSTCVRYM